MSNARPTPGDVKAAGHGEQWDIEQRDIEAVLTVEITAFAAPDITFEIWSTLDEPLYIRLADDIVQEITEDITEVHLEHDGENWLVFEDQHVASSRTVSNDRNHSGRRRSDTILGRYRLAVGKLNLWGEVAERKRYGKHQGCNRCYPIRCSYG